MYEYPIAQNAVESLRAIAHDVMTHNDPTYIRASELEQVADVLAAVAFAIATIERAIEQYEPSF